MNAQDCRKQGEHAWEQVHGATAPFVAMTSTQYQAQHVYALWEIAAQLAELNTNLSLVSKIGNKLSDVAESLSYMANK